MVWDLKAQSAAFSEAGSPETGEIHGVVTCADGRMPARLATVLLHPVPRETGISFRAVPVAETALDGSFMAKGIPTGEYYVTATMPGCLSELSRFSEEELTHPTARILVAVSAFLTPVLVNEKASSPSLSINLRKGGSISGVVRYNDGLPCPSADIALFQRSPNEQWVRYDITARDGMQVTTRTDDQGHYRVAGLPSGEYLLGITLLRKEYTLHNRFKGDTSTLGKSDIIYHDDVKEAQMVTIREGEQVNDLNIVVDTDTF